MTGADTVSPAWTPDAFEALDATALAALLRSGEAHPREVTAATIARIEAREPEISALSATLFERALEAAGGPTPSGAFAGVPIGYKDLNDLAGAPTTLGCRMFARYTPRASTPVVARMEAAGLTPIARTKTSEFGLMPSIETLAYGATANPWNLAHSPGGSSGGSAAAVAAGYFPLAQAGDGGGSIRIPASQCGVFGLKTTRSRLPLNNRAIPGDIQVEFCVSRSVRDSANLLAEIELQDGPLAPVGRVTGPSDRRLRVALWTLNGFGREPHPEVREGVLGAARLCEALGHAVEEASPELDLEALIDAFLALWAWIPGHLIGTWRIWPLRLLTRRFGPLGDLFEPWTLGLAAWHRARRRIDPDPPQRAIETFRVEARKFDKFFDRYDVWLTPVLRGPPPETGHLSPSAPFETLLERVLDHCSYTPLQNAIGTPAMSAPLHWTAAGLPIGAHFSTRYGDDRTLLELAFALEQAAPWAARYAEIGRGAPRSAALG